MKYPAKSGVFCYQASTARQVFNITPIKEIEHLLIRIP